VLPFEDSESAHIQELVGITGNKSALKPPC
jgi:hypothetical protein